MYAEGSQRFLMKFSRHLTSTLIVVTPWFANTGSLGGAHW